MLDKKDARKARDDFALHVLLLQREGLSKSVASFTAWAEGPAGLDRRLGQQSLLTVLDAALAASEAKPKAA